jgi:hypothetical protein
MGDTPKSRAVAYAHCLRLGETQGLKGREFVSSSRVGAAGNRLTPVCLFACKAAGGSLCLRMTLLRLTLRAKPAGEGAPW